MIISKTPLRISFFGGGSDYPEWYNDHGGVVLSTAINKFVYISLRELPPYFEHRHRIVYGQIENVKSTAEINHPAVRECFKYFKIQEGLELHYDADLPSKSGTGSSSSFTVGLLNSLHNLKKTDVSPHFLATEAINIEQNIIKESVGSQDQCAAAYGGFNYMEFSKDEISVSKIPTEKNNIKKLESHLLLVFAGFPHNASNIAMTYDFKNRETEIKEMMKLTKKAFYFLDNNRILEFGHLLNESWSLKKSLSNSISTPYIDYLYERSLKAGALGGKLMGAGGGGFMLLFCEPDKQEQLKKALEGMLFIPFKFEDNGSQIIFNNE